MARPSIYHFDDHADGEVYEIDCVKTFGPPQEGGIAAMKRMQAAMRVNGYRKGKSVHMRVVKGQRPRLLLQIVDKGEKPAPVFELPDDSLILHGRVSCPKCGRSAAQTEPVAAAGTSNVIEDALNADVETKRVSPTPMPSPDDTDLDMAALYAYGVDGAESDGGA